MPSPHNIELRSDEVQELLTKVPSAIIRWGITAIFFCLVLVLIVACFVKLPDQVNGAAIVLPSRAVEVQVPIENSGVIQEGQMILLQLDNFPSAKFGSIYTEVDSLYYDSNRKSYFVQSHRLDSLITNFGIVLEDLPYITGQATIRIGEQRVIHSILPFWASND